MTSYYTNVLFDGKKYRFIWQVHTLIKWRAFKCRYGFHKKDDYKVCHWCSKDKK